MNILHAATVNPASSAIRVASDPDPDLGWWVGGFDITDSFVTNQEMVIGTDTVGNPGGWASLEDAQAAVASLGLSAGIFKTSEDQFVARTLDFGTFAEDGTFRKFGSVTEMLASTTFDPEHNKIEFHSPFAPFAPLKSIVSGAEDGSIRQWWRFPSGSA